MEWIKLEDKAPPDDRNFIAITKNKYMYIVHADGYSGRIIYEAQCKCIGAEFSDNIEVDYWMELPEPPKVE